MVEEKVKVLAVSLIGIVLVAVVLHKSFLNPDVDEEMEIHFQGKVEEEVITPPNVTITKYNGVWLPFLREVKISLHEIDNLKLDGINIVAIGVKIHLDGDNITECESEDEMRSAINEFHKNGIKVFLILNPAHPDFGINPFSSEASGKPLLDKLTPLVLKWANISEVYGVEIFCPVNEPQLLSYQNEKDVSDWSQELLPKLREIYHGRIGFRVQNGSEGFAIYNLTGYDYVVFAGLACTKDIEEHPERIETSINCTVSLVKASYPDQKCLLFDCGAFTGPDHYWWEPIAPANMPSTMPDFPRDFFTVSNRSQAEFYNMFFNLTWNETEGYFIPVYKGWEYRGKPAEQVIRHWFNADIEVNSYGNDFGNSCVEQSMETSMVKPDPLTDNFTYTLPPGASPLRLSLPARIEDIFYSNKTGIGGFGLHAGGHIEGLDHVWIALKPGTAVKSWADGTVVDVRLSGMAEEREHHITIDYGQNLIGIHMEIETPLVEVGDSVKRGQEIGYGMSFDPEQSSAEFALVDMGRTDGVKYGGGGVYVSPFDYLEDAEKKKLVEAYKKYIIEPYLREGKKSLFFKPYQPYLTNRLFLHQGNEGKLSGEWYCLSSKWDQGFPNDMLTFIEAQNPYYSGNIVLAADDRDEGGKTDWSIEGTFEVDYEKCQIKITNYDGSIYFGIFEIDESGDRAKLKIEYQKDDYPTEFSTRAIIYIERTSLSRREDALDLGLIDSP